jgi:hypothetical protein
MQSSRRVRPSIRIAAAAVVLLLAGLLAAAAWARAQRRGAEQDLRAVVGPPEALPYASPRVDAEHNAALPLRAAVSLLAVPDAHRAELVALVLGSEGEWTEAQRDLAGSFLAANSAALAQLYAAGRLQASSFGLADPRQEPAEIQAMLPALRLLWAQRLLVMDAETAWRDGDRGRFAAAVGAMSSLAASLEREAPFLAGVSGVAAEQLLLAVVARTLARPECDATTVEVMRRALVLEDLLLAWRRAIVNEDRQADLNQQRYGQSERPTWIDRIALDRERAQQLRLCTALARAVEIPFGSTPSWRPDRERELTRLAPLAAPALVDGAVRFQATMAGRQLAAAGLWLKERGLDGGAYPTSLDGCPAAAGPDPFSGRPLLFAPSGDGGVNVSVDGGQALWVATPGGSASPMTLTVTLPPVSPPA